VIRRVTSSLSTFKAFSLRNGLNIILADRAPDSTLGSSRNGAGKSSLVEIFHFALGANASDGSSIFKTPTLINHKFVVEIDLPNGTCQITRSGSDQNHVFVEPASLGFPIRPTSQRSTGHVYFSVKVWRTVLGSTFFGLPISDAETGGPTFRALISYLIRRVGSGGLIEPHRCVQEQQLSNSQTNLSFLFDLDYRLPMALDSVRKRERQLRELRSAARSGAFGSVVHTVAQIRPQLAAAEARVNQLRYRLSSFIVLDEYNVIVQEIASLRSELRKIAEENLIDEDRLTQLRSSLETEQDVDEQQIANMFSELQDLIPNAIQRRLDAVARFHRSVIDNRRHALVRELEQSQVRIRERTEAGRALDNRRSTLMRTLEGRGALEDFTHLQTELARDQQELAQLRTQFATAQMLEGDATGLEIEKREIERRTREDHAIRNTRLEHAALIVRELVQSLYDDRIGNLLIDVTPNGPYFRIEIEGDRSEGISRMEIWCFDMLVSRLLAERNLGPRILVHDSHIFDGVDGRQVSAALKQGLSYAQEFDFQYIVTMNSDVFGALEIDVNVRNTVIEPRLSDQRADGGIFGTIIEDVRREMRLTPEADEESATDEEIVNNEA